MMIRNVDANGDFVFGHSLADYLTGDAAIALLLEQRLQLWLGEWFLDVTAGVNWWQVLGTRPPALLLAEQELRRIALATDGVVKVTNLALAFSHKTFIANIQCSVTTVNATGVITINFQQSVQAGVR